MQFSGKSVKIGISGYTQSPEASHSALRKLKEKLPDTFYYRPLGIQNRRDPVTRVREHGRSDQSVFFLPVQFHRFAFVTT